MKKILTMFFTCAVLVIMGASMAFAQGWAQDANGVWSFTDKDGEKKTECFVKSGEDWYWLNEDGNMAIAQLVEYNDNLYCVDETGRMICSNWVKANTEEFPDKWLYFGSNGRAYKNGWKTIKDQKYHFTEYAMDQGFLDENAAMIDADVEEPWKIATYYVGDAGAMKKNEWLEVESFDSENGKAWVFFGANGKKVVDCKKTINGKTYVFGADGAMKTSFVDATVSSASISVYMDENGAMLKKGWTFAYLNDDAEEQNWFYAAGNGQLVKNCVKTINDKKYAFDEEGRMLTGFVVVSDSGVKKVASAEDVTSEYAFADYGNDINYMYFTESATPSEQGPAKTGKQTFEGYDWKFTVNFSSRGIATTTNELVVKNNYLYKNSVLVAFEDYGYKYEPVKVDGVEYVCTVKSGRVAKKGTFTDADNDVQYKIENGKVAVYKKDAANKWAFVEYYFSDPV